MNSKRAHEQKKASSPSEKVSNLEVRGCRCGMAVALSFVIGYSLGYQHRSMSLSPFDGFSFSLCESQSVASVISKNNKKVPNILPNGWDQGARDMYNKTQQELASKNKTAAYTFPALEGRMVDPIVVDVSTPHDKGFWNSMQSGRWERQTFVKFSKYVTGRTTVIDFGSWIGPTLLYHAQFSKRSFAIEADPHAYAKVKRNLELNSHQPWARRTLIQPACVGTQDESLQRMKSSSAGNSCSSLADMASCGGGSGQGLEWDVRCYTLPRLFREWNIDLKGGSDDDEEEHVVIKVDVESYECVLLPTLHPWLRNLTSANTGARLPTMFVSFHPQIAPCKEEDLAALLPLFQLYPSISCGNHLAPMPRNVTSSLSAFKEHLTANGCDVTKAGEGIDFILHDPEVG